MRWPRWCIARWTPENSNSERFKTQAANLFYKVIDARSGQRSTALATNIDFEAWSEYLGDPPLAMAFLDRVVDGAILLKIRGKSYRAHRAKRPPGRSKHDTT